jgi:hypothetical protein
MENLYKSIIVGLQSTNEELEKVNVEYFMILRNQNTYVF